MCTTSKPIRRVAITPLALALGLLSSGAPAPSTADIIDDFQSGAGLTCGDTSNMSVPSNANVVWADTDGIDNGPPYGVYDTQVEFFTYSGEAMPTPEYTPPGLWYYFTGIDNSCGNLNDYVYDPGPPANVSYGKGRLKIHFIDMLAPGFVWSDPSTWTFKAVPSVTIKATHDYCVASDIDWSYAQLYVRAYTGLGQQGLVEEIANPAGGWTQYSFAHPDGIMELAIATDFCENNLDDLEIGINTLWSDNVEVDLGQAVVTFDSVTATGNTTITQSASSEVEGELPGDFSVCDPPVYYDITTTAGFIGSVEVCIDYSDTCAGDDVRIFHAEPTSCGTGDCTGYGECPAWLCCPIVCELGFVDVTTSVDTVNHRVCGVVTDLSEFVVGSATGAGPEDADGDGIPDAEDQCPGTPQGEAVDANGCSASQRDSDGDGVSDADDQCPGTPAGTAVDGDGCPLAPVTCEPPGDLDGDGDVDRDDLNVVLAARNTPASGPDDCRDLDDDGQITALDARKLVTMCTLPRCATP